MCGACGAASAGTASMHWSTPFLGSVPARGAAARNLTAWARRAGSSLTVTGVSSGFQVATASGGRQLFGDLAAVVDELARQGVELHAMAVGPVPEQVVEGPPTCPPERPGLSLVRADHPTGEDVTVLPAEARRPYRVPALLAWLELASGAGLLSPVRLEIDLGRGLGLELSVSASEVTYCRARRTTGPDRILTPTGSAPPDLLYRLVSVSGRYSDSTR